MSKLSSKPVVVGRYQRVVEILRAVGGIVFGVVVFVLCVGVGEGLKYVWLPVIGAAGLVRILFIRLQLRGRTLEIPVVGSWRRSVDLDSLESIRWKRIGGSEKKGTIFVRDRNGHQLPIYVGVFTGGEVWGKLLLDAAARAGASIDEHSKHILETEAAASGNASNEASS